MSEWTHAEFAQAEQRHGQQRHEQYQYEEAAGPSSPWVGWLAFAALVMAVTGGLYIVAGLVTLFDSRYYEVNTAVLTVDQSWTVLGWTQLILGVLVVAAGVTLLRGHLWARLLAVLFAGLTIVENFLDMAAAPVWHLLLIGLAVVAIYAIIVHGREAVRA